MPTPRDPTEARTLHHRITLRHTHRGPVPGMHQPSKVTPVGKTTHFEISYLTTLGKKGDTLAGAILHNCERDYAALKKFFGGLTPKRLPFVVQVTAGCASRDLHGHRSPGRRVLLTPAARSTSSAR